MNIKIFKSCKVATLLMLASGRCFASDCFKEIDFYISNDGSCAMTNTTAYIIYTDHFGTTRSGNINVGTVPPATTVFVTSVVGNNQYLLTGTLCVNGGYGGTGSTQCGLKNVLVHGQGQACCSQPTSCSGGVCLHHTVDAPVNNVNSTTCTAYWKFNGQIVHSALVPPGGGATFTYDFDGCADLNWGLNGGGVNTDGGGGGNITLNGGGNTDLSGGGGGNPWSGGGYNGGPLDTGTNFNILPGTGHNSDTFDTNGPIVWSGNTNGPNSGLALDSTLRGGFGALDYDIQTLQQELAVINNSINAHSNSSGSVTVSNFNSVSITNNTSFTNNVSVTTTNIGETGVSNLLGSALSTNFPNYDLDGGTNQSGAGTKATTALADAPGKLDSIVTGIGSAPDVSGGSAAMTIELAGYTLDLDPAVRFPGAQELCFNGMSLAAILAFGYFAGKLIRESVQTYAMAETGGVPDLEVTAIGTGGNVAGTIVALVVAAVFIGLWLAFFYFVFDAVLSRVGALNAMNPFSSLSGIGLYLLTSFFPVTLILTLAWTAIGLQVGAAKLMLVAASASRFLFGK
jgi:hypothetical protein